MKAKHICIILILILLLPLAYGVNRIIRDIYNDLLRTQRENYLLDRWVSNLQKGHKIERFFSVNGKSRVCIYGCNSLGIRLLNELRGTDIRVPFFVDEKRKNMMSFFGDTKIVGESEIEEMDNIDIIIVTDVLNTNGIINELRSKTKCSVIGIDYLLGVVYGE